MQAVSGGESFSRRRIFQIYRRREMWDITRPETIASPIDATSVISAIGRYDGAFVKSLTRFNQLLLSGSLGIIVPPRPRHGHLEDNAATVIREVLDCSLFTR